MAARQDEAHALAADLARAVDGEVRFDDGGRAIYATDASNYRQPPIGVVIPRHADDVVATLAVCREHGAPVLPRGGGTSLAGQCCNRAVVLDFTKYMGAVREVDGARRLARVEPGCVLDDLRAAAAPHGLTYGPDPATHSHCTLGGMIGNNSCGVHSVLSEFHGVGPRTADHVEELEVVTYRGLRLRVGATSEGELASIIEAGGERGRIYRALRDLRDRVAPLVRARYHPIPRRVSGYNLDELLPERGFQVARALAGSEGTCATLLEATLRLDPAFPGRALVVLGYPSVFEAGDHVPVIRGFRPIGLEGMDDRLVHALEKTGLHVGTVRLLPEGRGWLLVELGGETRDEAVDRAHGLMDALRRDRNPPSMKLFADRAEEEKIWKVRESGLGATAFVPGEPDTWPGWEDSAVPPDRVGAYLRELRALFDRFGYHPAVYGHFGQGCVHCRIDFDLRSADGIARYRQFTDQAADLCLRHGGSLSGEHGDGQSRGELLVKQYGPELMAAFHEFRRIWDPDEKMNPGKVVPAASRTADLRIAGYRPAPVATHFAFARDQGDFRRAAIRCVGVGECRRKGGGTMCPSYMVTGEEMHSTRGRARILFEMMQGEIVADGWRSEAVKEALDLCLACKGCKGDCPVKVDMATYKAEFLSHYYRGRARPRQAYAFGWIHRWARLAALAPGLVNAAAADPLLGRIARWLAGMAPERDIPRFAPRSFQRIAAGNPPGADGQPVVLWPDTFNNHFHPETLLAARAVLAAAGYRPLVPKSALCCGRALYDYGFLDQARRLWRRTLHTLAPAIAAGLPVVVAEPSCAAAFRDELPDLMAGDPRADRLARLTCTLSELLLRDGFAFPAVGQPALVHGHCHQKAVLGFEADRQALARMQVEAEVLDSGCCGMAGSFGFERDHYRISLAIGERVLLPAVRRLPAGTLLLADGFSCREQVRQATGRRAAHLAELIAFALEDAGRLRRPAVPAAVAAEEGRRSARP